MINSAHIKKDFPILQRKINGKPLVYLDSAATSQKPQSVIDAISNYYKNHNANVHRGVHQLSDESTLVFEKAHQKIAKFLGAKNEELILTRNTTEAINGVIYGWADHNLEPGDIVLTTLMEHHSSFVVWQQVCERTGARLEFVTLTAEGRLDLEDLKAQLQHPRVKLLALAHVSNTLGTLNPISEITELVKTATRKNQNKIRILLDSAQSVPHMKLNFDKLGVDFVAFSGHKMLGPMGIGGLLVKAELLESDEFRPWLFGGGMIMSVATDKTNFHEDLVERFTAGTPDVASTVGLAAACDYLDEIGMQEVEEHDRELVAYALEKLGQLPKLEIIGPVKPVVGVSKFGKDGQLDRLGSVAFLYKGVHAHDVAQVLSSEGIAVRSGHHCTMPLHTHFGWQATLRASFQVYTSQEDIDALVEALNKVEQVFNK